MNDKTNVDVLAVLDAYCAQYARGKGTDLKEARAAVAELVAAADELSELLIARHDSLITDRLRAALARVGGGQ